MKVGLSFFYFVDIIDTCTASIPHNDAYSSDTRSNQTACI